MRVPKAAVDENDLFPLAKNKVWRPWKVSPMETISIAHTMNETSHDHLGFCVLLADTAHHPTSVR